MKIRLLPPTLNLQPLFLRCLDIEIYLTSFVHVLLFVDFFVDSFALFLCACVCVCVSSLFESLTSCLLCTLLFSLLLSCNLSFALTQLSVALPPPPHQQTSKRTQYHLLLTGKTDLLYITYTRRLLGTPIHHLFKLSPSLQYLLSCSSPLLSSCLHGKQLR